MSKKRTTMLASGMFVASALNVIAANKTDKPNIIFILCDDMGYGDLACYGQKYIQTPHIDRLASEGMKFTSTLKKNYEFHRLYTKGKSAVTPFLVVYARAL